MTKLCEDLEGVLGVYLGGRTYEAYQWFEASLKPILVDLERLMVPPGWVGRRLVVYRIRRTTRQRLRRQDIFHLPFELRHKATMKRYSVPGVPMLYLGGCVYICWKEMGSPRFDEIQVSAFGTRKDASPRILNFGFRPGYIGRLVKDANNMRQQGMREFVTSYCVCWPLMALCSIKAKRRDKPFVPEYVLPQMVLQWLTARKELAGIRYFSCNWDHDTGEPYHMCNCVFPPKEFPVAGLCRDLQTLFDWTSPLPWRELVAATPSPIDMTECPDVDIKLPHRIITNYRSTVCGRVEACLHGRILKRLHVRR